MTVCISALCAGPDGAAKNVVVVSDRMVTLGRLTEFEHEVPKITNITDKVVALIAGDALRGSQLIRNVIESGALQALQSMIGFGHMSGRSLHQTVFACYASKRRAEVAPGVGKDTDLAILSNKGMFKADKTALDSLEELYQEYQKPASDVLMKKAEEITNKLN